MRSFVTRRRLTETCHEEVIAEVDEAIEIGAGHLPDTIPQGNSNPAINASECDTKVWKLLDDLDYGEIAAKLPVQYRHRPEIDSPRIASRINSGEVACGDALLAALLRARSQ